jgi:hypothetical protein
MVGLARAGARGKRLAAREVGQRYRALLADEEFMLASSKATADEENVKKRLKIASRVFAAR